MSAKVMCFIVFAITAFQIYFTGFEFGLFLFIPARIWFILTFQGVKSHAVGETIVESLGWVIQLIVLTFVKFNVNWWEYLVMLGASTVLISFIWYEEIFMITLDVPEDEIESHIK